MNEQELKQKIEGIIIRHSSRNMVTSSFVNDLYRLVRSGISETTYSVRDLRGYSITGTFNTKEKEDNE